MNTGVDDMTRNSINLAVEIRFANGSSKSFHDSDPERVREALRLLAAPQLFAQPHLLLASHDQASMLLCKGIDMILARTSEPLPIRFPLEHPSGLFDFVELPMVWPYDPVPATEVSAERSCLPRQRASRVDIDTVGGWSVRVGAVAMFHGNAHDERQFFALVPSIPTIPFRLKDGGFGLLNTANIVAMSASPRPEMLPKTILPLAATDQFRRH